MLPLFLWFGVLLVARVESQCSSSNPCRDSSAPCCSQYGWCGSSDAYCGAGCQSNAGSCTGSNNNNNNNNNNGGCQADGGSGDWDFCSYNWQCGNGCCSKEWSNDGCYKCTPGGSQCTGKPNSPSPNPPSPSPHPSGGGSGSISSIIDKNSFNNALHACNVWGHDNLYESFVKGFTAPLNGKKELALLMGNTAHESGAYQYTEEIACAGVTSVTGSCPYGLWHGRGYIQISWEDNYKAAAAAVGNPEIHSNPWIVQNDESVNFQTVQWYWTTSVQPKLKSEGYSLGVSVKYINGYLECPNINSQRVQWIQCFQKQFGVDVDWNPTCSQPSGATTSNTVTDSTTPSTSTTNDATTVSVTETDSGVPGYAVGLLVIGSILVVLLVVLVVVVQRR